MSLTVPKLLEVSTRRASPLNADTGRTEPSEQVAQPAFLTLQVLATFPGATTAVTIVWKVLAEVVSAPWASSRLVPAVGAPLIGFYLLLKGFEGKSLSAADGFGTVLVGVFNGVIIWSAVVGVDVGLDSLGALPQTGESTGSPG